ncbi:MAG: ABC transporter ATP-binding protein [Planctomycetes bacterium]|nr:ABC transporter ATP-binding protein [Planctomycetota bacterium]
MNSTSTPRDVLAIDVRGLVRTFGDRRAVDGLDLALARGASLGLLGPNGAGKTTTIRILSTLARATSGSVRVLGLDPERDALELRARIGVVPQELALYDELSARENLEFFARAHRVDARRVKERVDWALELAQLAERARDRVTTFSGGMKRRLNLVVALLHEPELVFLDEPTVGIDPQSRNHVFEMVERLVHDGTTLVYTTHQLGEVERLCERIVVLDRGRKIAEGTLAELQHLPGLARSHALRVTSEADAHAAQAFLAQRGVETRLVEELPGLESVFLELTGHALRDDDA